MTNLLPELRTTRGWSQAQLAEKLALSRQTIIAIEQSKTDPSLYTAMRISWLFRQPVESIFLADLDEQMDMLQETWQYKKKAATATNELGILESMGEEGWEMTGFGLASLQFRRPATVALRRQWQYHRVQGFLSGTTRAELEKRTWSYLGNWLGTFHYFKRQARPGLPTD